MNISSQFFCEDQEDFGVYADRVNKPKPDYKQKQRFDALTTDEKLEAIRLGLADIYQRLGDKADYESIKSINKRAERGTLGL